MSNCWKETKCKCRSQWCTDANWKWKWQHAISTFCSFDCWFNGCARSCIYGDHFNLNRIEYPEQNYIFFCFAHMVLCSPSRTWVMMMHRSIWMTTIYWHKNVNTVKLICIVTHNIAYGKKDTSIANTTMVLDRLNIYYLAFSFISAEYFQLNPHHTNA